MKTQHVREELCHTTTMDGFVDFGGAQVEVTGFLAMGVAVDLTDGRNSSKLSVRVDYSMLEKLSDFFLRIKEINRLLREQKP